MLKFSPQASEQYSNSFFQQQQCQLCQQQNLSVMLNRALFDRYLSNINMYYLYPIQQFIQQQPTPQTILFKQHLIDTTQQQLLKRSYQLSQYNNKIQTLSQYYKFHRDVPRLFQKDVFKILGKYYDKLRHYDYKNIKKILKQQQNISLTTEKSQESSYHSSIEIKSKYSDVLAELKNDSNMSDIGDNLSQSNLLKNFCQKIDKYMDNDKINYKKQFKGQYYSGEKKFQEYLLNLNYKKKQNKEKKQKHNPFIIERLSSKRNNYNLYPYQQKLENIGVQFGNNNTNSIADPFKKKSSNNGNSKKPYHNNKQSSFKPTNLLQQSLKNFKLSKASKHPTKKSIQKTTANQTISRQQKSSINKLSKHHLQKTLQLQIQKQHNKIFKPLSTALLQLKSNNIMKTIDQIYRPNNNNNNNNLNNNNNEKYYSDKRKPLGDLISGNKNSQCSSQNNGKMYQNKLSSRNSNIKKQNKISSNHNSQQYKNQNHIHIKQYYNNDNNNNDNNFDNGNQHNHNNIQLNNHINNNQPQTNHQNLTSKPSSTKITRNSSGKRLSKTKSTPKVSSSLSNLHKKTSQYKLKTIDYIFKNNQKQRQKSNKKSTTYSHKKQSNRSLSSHSNILTKINNFIQNDKQQHQQKHRKSTTKCSKSKSNLLKQPSSSSLHNKNQLSSTQKIPLSSSSSSSKSKINSARHNNNNILINQPNNDKHKFHTIDNNNNNNNEHNNKKIQKILQKKLNIFDNNNINMMKKPLIAKFYN